MRNNRSGFTLLEIIIVIIIVGVLASLALPRLFSTVEYSKSTEALAAFATIRSSMERCHLQKSEDYQRCQASPGAFDNLDIEDPGSSPGAHFTYAVEASAADSYIVYAQRTTFDGGDTTGNSWIVLSQQGTVITKTGAGDFSNL